MAIADAPEALIAEARLWRRDLHQMPELLFDLPRTSAFVREKLESFGCDEVVSGIAESGVVAVIHGRLGPGRTIGFRADMDALPIEERTNLPYASKVPGRMHACGHDGHTAMLLAAAKHLAAHKDFAGTLVFIFQPAEEGGGGAKIMLDEGLFERFPVEEVYGMHNQPRLPVGSFAIRPGPILGAVDRFTVELEGRSGHAAYPHMTRDPIHAGAALVGALQSVVSRHVDPVDPVVLSITYFAGGRPDALNVIPGSVTLGGTIRTVREATRRSVEQRFRDMVGAHAKLFDIEATIAWEAGYPVTANDPARTDGSIAAAKQAAREAAVIADWPLAMGAEDFSYMLQQRPGTFIWLGNGDSADVHNSSYDFNDDAIASGVRYWCAMADQRLAAAPET